MKSDLGLTDTDNLSRDMLVQGRRTLGPTSWWGLMLFWLRAVPGDKFVLMSAYKMRDWRDHSRSR